MSTAKRRADAWEWRRQRAWELHLPARPTPLPATATTWDALLDLHVFEQNWLHPHPALRQPVVVAWRVYDPRTPAMALHLADHVWTWREFLTTPTRVSSYGSHYPDLHCLPFTLLLLTQNQQKW